MDTKTSYVQAIEALRLQLDPGSRTLAAQDFRHTSQAEDEKVADFIRRLERTFNVAYGREGMSAETRDTLLHGQLQDGLKHELMRAAAVSGAQSYKALCLAARNEEKRLAELKKRQQYLKSASTPPRPAKKFIETRSSMPLANKTQVPSVSKTANQETKRCFMCHKPGHLARDCRFRTAGSSGHSDSRKTQSGTKQVTAESDSAQEGQFQFLQGFLCSSDEEDTTGVKVVRVPDRGSQPQCVKVQVQGVPAYGVLDSGADITIMGGTLFRKVATIARLKRRDLKRPDKTPRNYDQTPFTLDGRMDLDITFNGKTMRTPVYIKTNAHEQLLLSEGVCRQLDILRYHPDVEPWRGGKKRDQTQTRTVGPAHQEGSSQDPVEQTTTGEVVEGPVMEIAEVPTVRVMLVQSLRLLPHQGASVTVQLDSDSGLQNTESMLLEPSCHQSPVEVHDSLLKFNRDGHGQVAVYNPTGCSCFLEAGAELGEASVVTIVQPNLAEAAGDHNSQDSSPPFLKHITGSCAVQRKQEIKELVGEPALLTPEQTAKLHQFLGEHHKAFCLEANERGETDLFTMEIDTGEARPKKQVVRRMPFAVRAEVAKQLRSMQEAGVIQPSSSPWASPVVMVRKRDGTHRFCVDYRELNSVTKADTFPLPRIDDLLDQLGAARYFSTLDLASGYWQIRMHPNLIEKTAFVTPQGLHEFWVMPFGLTNAPGVFQRLMERVLAGLNPEDGPDFVVVYIDDVLVISRTLDDHLEHLRCVIQRIHDAGLKLKPSKCRFIRDEVEYLGHLITPQGLKTNSRLTAAITEFPRPRNLPEVRRFLGLSSYYRRFVPNFSKIASPLQALTRKGAEFIWTSEREASFQTLKEKLVSAPVLAYPSFEKTFVLETDASVVGIGAVLSQQQEDGLLHPIAYASRSLTSSERNYAITELETLAVVWAITHFIPYLYGHEVTVYTDHTAVKAVLETPNPTGKIARWWTKVYGSGVKGVTIRYRPGRQNGRADALSRSPQAFSPAMGVGQSELQVAAVSTDDAGEAPDIGTFLNTEPICVPSDDFASEQRKDPDLREIVDFLEKEELPSEEKRARRIALQASLFTIEGRLLLYIDPKQKHRKRVAVPRHLREQILKENHSSGMSGHFSGSRTYNVLVRNWWWDGMHADTLRFARNCPACAIVSGGGRPTRPPLHPIPVQRPFQIVGMDIMDLPKTNSGNCHVLVFQDYLTKWPLVFPIPDQKSIRIVQILAEEVVPFFGVPEALLSDRGTNLMSHLMRDLCDLLGIKKLNTTAYHPQRDGLVERFNRTLKTMIRKQAATFGSQWDRYLPGVLWAYQNTPHEVTGEKPSFLLFGFDLRTPTEAALLPCTPLEPTTVTDYREQVILSLSTARSLAAESIRKAQKKYKALYDRKTAPVHLQVGDWVLVKFPHEEVGKNRKLSRPWHGPYRIVSRDDPDVTVVKVYSPQDKPIRVHMSRVTPCPSAFPAGYYWYGTRRHSPGRPPKWVQKLLDADEKESAVESELESEMEMDDTQAKDSSEIEMEGTGDGGYSEQEHESGDEMDRKTVTKTTRANCGLSDRYSLRRQVVPPERLMIVQTRSRSSSPEGAGNVTD